jgi:cytochrome c-type biogenesis protein CcmF
MAPEIGNFLLCLACTIAVLLSVYPLIAATRLDKRLMTLARPLAGLLFVSVSSAFGFLVYALVVNDFSVSYVVENSNSLLPLGYRIAASWGAHEGSLLLWLFILSGWTLAVAIFSRRLPQDDLCRVLAIMGMINLGFLLFIILTSNPFARTLPDFPIDGRDLNPMLQDIGLIVHPPLLYMGYVGFSVAFAFAIAALLSGKVDTAWARWSRPWTTAAWLCLTIGIVLGSAWAYYELGWGGWWFWDPVENASFMPWLAGTALIHSLAVTEKRGSFKAWTVLLAIISFSLSLLGTFLVRSGVLVSIHSFAADPTRGLFILILLLLVIGSALLLYTVRARSIRSRVHYALCSRETLLLSNNILLIAAMLVVLLGTLLPLIHQQLGLGSISIGEPFFNQLFTGLAVPFAFLLGIGPLVRWRRDSSKRLAKLFFVPLLLSFIAALLLPWWLEDSFSARALLGGLMALWVVVLTVIELREKATIRRGFWQGVFRLSASQWGMTFGHLGFAVTVFGIVFTTEFSIEHDVRLKPGESITIRHYRFTFNEVKSIQGPNYRSQAGIITVTHNGEHLPPLVAEKRFYSAARTTMTEAAISGNLRRDLYAALGEAFTDGSYAFRIYYKPFVRWIWLGGLIMALGGIFCVLDKRYLMRRSIKNHHAK